MLHFYLGPINPFWQFWTHVAQFLRNFQILAFMLYWKAEASYCQEKLHKSKSLVTIVDGKCSGKSFVSLQTGPRLCRAKGVSNTIMSGWKIPHNPFPSYLPFFWYTKNLIKYTKTSIFLSQFFPFEVAKTWFRFSKWRVLLCLQKR